MRTQGKILREPGAGPGLLMIEGQQYRFSLEGEWKSEVVPKRGLVVEVELDRNLRVVSAKAVPEAQASTDRSTEKQAGLIRRLVAKAPAFGRVAGWKRRRNNKTGELP